MAGERVLLVDDSAEQVRFVRDHILEPNGYIVLTAVDGEEALRRALTEEIDLLMIDLRLPGLSGLQVLRSLKEKGRQIPTILMTFFGSEETAIEAFRLGAKDYLIKPFTVAEALEAIERALSETRLRREKAELERGLLQMNRQLAQRVKELNILANIGKSVTQLLDLETLLNRVVEAAVYITKAEEGSLLLVDESTGELYLRAARGLGDRFARGFRLRVDESLAGQVVQTGKPVRIESVSAQKLKIKTGYLVKSLLNVPLKVGDKVIGVLGVDNKVSTKPFTENDEELLSALADYASISIVNAQLYQALAESRDEIQRWNRELEKRVAERTEELQQMQRQLARAERLAAVGHLAAGVAHELNNPLSVILGFAEVIPQLVGPDQVLAKPLEAIQREAVRCRRIVKSLLEFARQSRLSLGPVDLNQLLDETLPLLEHQISRRGIAVVKEYSPSLPLITADRGQLQQVLVNLLLNAAQAMPEGGRLTLRTEAHEEHVLLEIADTGVGIPEEHLQHIFEPFFSTKDVGEGSGLGLAVSHGIIQQHGGTIAVTSQVGVGTTFTITLPVRAAQPQSALQPA